jgi:hypothetical protein
MPARLFRFVDDAVQHAPNRTCAFHPLGPNLRTGGRLAGAPALRSNRGGSLARSAPGVGRSCGLRRDRDGDLSQEAMQALADVFLVVAEVGQEGAQGVVDEEQLVVSELESGHTQKGPLTARCRIRD